MINNNSSNKEQQMNINTVATPNRNRPEALVIDQDFYNEIKRIRNEVEKNTHTYKGKTDKQQNTLEYLDGILKNIRNLGSLTEKQIRWLIQTSNVCYGKKNIDNPLTIPNDLITVSDYYTPKKIEEKEDKPLELTTQAQIDLLADAIELTNDSIKELQREIAILRGERK